MIANCHLEQEREILYFSSTDSEDFSPEARNDNCDPLGSD